MREPLLDHLRTQEGQFQSHQRARLFSAVRKKVVGMKVIHSFASAYRQRVSPDRWAGTTPPFGVIPFRNLKRSLSVERTRVVFSAMMDL